MPEPKLVRESREWWVVHDGTVMQALGLSCAPDNPDVWWFPSIGYSMTMGYHVFAERDAAIRACRMALQSQMTACELKLKALDAKA